MIDGKKKTMALLGERGGKSVRSVAASAMLSVGSNQPLKRVPSLVLAVCIGLDIVTEKCLAESH